MDQTLTTPEVPQKPVTRIDLERVGAGDFVLVNKWIEGWQEGKAPDIYESSEGVSLDHLVQQLTDQGFTVRVYKGGKEAKALRGDITRIDFLLDGDVWTVNKYPFGWTASTFPISSEKKGADFDLDKALTWLRDHNWTVIQWPGGARAWDGQMKPVHDKDTILAMRRRLEADKHYIHEFDLAFYF